MFTFLGKLNFFNWKLLIKADKRFVRLKFIIRKQGIFIKTTFIKVIRKQKNHKIE